MSEAEKHEEKHEETTSSHPEWEERMVDMAGEAAENFTRFSLNIMSLPLMALPGKSREHARRALSEFAIAFMTFPREIAENVEQTMEHMAGEEGTERMQKPRNVARRASALADRLVRTAEEFSTGK